MNKDTFFSTAKEAIEWIQDIFTLNDDDEVVREFFESMVNYETKRFFEKWLN
jgi:hypothetical protein